MSEVERRLVLGRLRTRRTGMPRHFMLMVAAHGQRVAQWQQDRGKPYWRRAKKSRRIATPMGVHERALRYARQNGCDEAQAQARASAAEGLVIFHSAKRARVGLLRLRFTIAQARNLLKRRPGMRGAKPLYTVIDEVIDGAA